MIKNKKRKDVFILTATYKDNNTEAIGAFDSMQAMMRGFAKCVAEDVICESSNRGLPFDKLAKKVAVELADLIPAFFDEDYPRDAEGCIGYGNTTYGYCVMDLKGVEDFVDRGETGEEDLQD